jgi:hypothetical protein
MIYVTVHPDQIDPSILKTVDVLFVLGNAPENTVRIYCEAVQQPPPRLTACELEPGRALMWERATGEHPAILEVAPSTVERRRHRRKYAEGELPQDRSFYFKGPHGQLNLRAQNLLLFMQLGEGVDEATWTHHLHAHDYSTWIGKAIKDDALAKTVREVEEQSKLSAEESRRLIRAAIETRYTVPAGRDDHAS